MTQVEGVLVGGPLSGRRVYVHLFAFGLPMQNILVVERPLRGLGERLRWRLWGEPPAAAAHRYRIHREDDSPDASRARREVRYVFDPSVAEEPPGSTEEPDDPFPQPPTEVVFVRSRGSLDQAEPPR